MADAVAELARRIRIQQAIRSSRLETSLIAFSGRSASVQRWFNRRMAMLHPLSNRRTAIRSGRDKTCAE